MPSERNFAGAVRVELGWHRVENAEVSYGQDKIPRWFRETGACGAPPRVASATLNDDVRKEPFERAPENATLN
jgi:hypothetical protein